MPASAAAVQAAAAQSAGLVDRELSAAARVIARAVRLRIRLAPGVRLVDVVGSERLDAGDHFGVGISLLDGPAA